MRTIDANITAALASGTLRPFLLLEITIDATGYKYTDCDVPLVVGGKRYSPRGFRLEPVRYSMSNIVDSMRAATDNLDDVLTAAFVDGTPQKSGVVLSLVVMDANYAAIAAPIILFEGLIDEWSLTESEITMTVANLLTAWNQRTLGKHSASCRWKKFKGQECGYIGTDAWCDRSFTRCEALGNQANFGGFRWLPSIVDKEVWWGRARG